LFRFIAGVVIWVAFLNTASAHIGLSDDLKTMRACSKAQVAALLAQSSGRSTAGQPAVPSYNLGETALICAVAGALMALGLFPALAAAVSPLVVKRFILPTRDELCAHGPEALSAPK
jgi:hypothetical protein